MSTVTASATATRHRDGVWTLKIESCPFCHKSHRHGGGMGPTPSGGWRQSHCLHNARQYQIVPTVAPVEQLEEVGN